jgi:hypothetical protein
MYSRLFASISGFNFFCEGTPKMITDSPFYKVVNDFLEERLTAFQPEKMDQVYAAKYEAVEQLEEKLLSLLPDSVDTTFGKVGIHKILTGLSDAVSKFKEKLQSDLPGTVETETESENSNEALTKLIEDISGFEKQLQTMKLVVFPVDAHKILVELIDETSHLEGIATEYAYKKGFSEGVKFIFHSLTMS